LGQSYFRDKNGRGKHEKALSNEMSWQFQTHVYKK
jgi:hypothetical protein